METDDKKCTDFSKVSERSAAGALGKRKLPLGS